MTIGLVRADKTKKPDSFIYCLDDDDDYDDDEQEHASHGRSRIYLNIADCWILLFLFNAFYYHSSSSFQTSLMCCKFFGRSGVHLLLVLFNLLL